MIENIADQIDTRRSFQDIFEEAEFFAKDVNTYGGLCINEMQANNVQLPYCTSFTTAVAYMLGTVEATKRMALALATGQNPSILTNGDFMKGGDTIKDVGLARQDYVRRMTL